jgi:hypothetical protein
MGFRKNLSVQDLYLVYVMLRNVIKGALSLRRRFKAQSDIDRYITKVFLLTFGVVFIPGGLLGFGAAFELTSIDPGRPPISSMYFQTTFAMIVAFIALVYGVSAGRYFYRKLKPRYPKRTLSEFGLS